MLRLRDIALCNILHIVGPSSKLFNRGGEPIHTAVPHVTSQMGPETYIIVLGTQNE